MTLREILDELNSQPQGADSLRDAVIALCEIVGDQEHEIRALKKSLANAKDDVSNLEFRTRNL